MLMAWEEGRYIFKASVLPQAGWDISSVQLVKKGWIPTKEFQEDFLKEGVLELAQWFSTRGNFAPSSPPPISPHPRP